MDGGSVHSWSRTRSAPTEEGIEVAPFPLSPDGRWLLGAPFPLSLQYPRHPGPRSARPGVASV
jgi:hypothetical protein